MMGVMPVQDGPLQHLLDKPYMKMLRITTYVFRFIYRRQNSNLLTTDEIEKAEKFWICLAQQSIDLEKDQNDLEERVYII